MAVVADKSGNNPTDVKWTSASRNVAGDPNTTGPLTPAFAGEIVLDTTNHAWWKSTTMVNASWIALTTPYTA